MKVNKCGLNLVQFVHVLTMFGYVLVGCLLYTYTNIQEVEEIIRQLNLTLSVCCLLSFKFLWFFLIFVFFFFLVAVPIFNDLHFCV